MPDDVRLRKKLERQFRTDVFPRLWETHWGFIARIIEMEDSFFFPRFRVLYNYWIFFQPFVSFFFGGVGFGKCCVGEGNLKLLRWRGKFLFFYVFFCVLKSNNGLQLIEKWNRGIIFGRRVVEIDVELCVYVCEMVWNHKKHDIK